MARISRLWATNRVSRGQQNIEYRKLFECYGNVVRTGPNYPIIMDAGAIPAIHGIQNRWLRYMSKLSA